MAIPRRLVIGRLRGLAQNQLTFIVCAAIVLVLLGAVIVGLLESALADAQAAPAATDFSTFGNSLWWSVVTILTVGYGDIAPKTALGRVAASVVMISGVIVTSLFTATVASMFTERRLKEARGLQHIRARDHIVICGANSHLEPILEGFARSSDRAALVDVTLVNDLLEDEVQQLLLKYEGLRPKWVKGDFSQEAVLQRANVQQARAALVLASTERHQRTADERTLLATLAIKHIRPEVHVCVELLDAANEGHLRIAQADDVIVTGEHTGFLLSSAAVAPGLPQAVRALMSPSSSSPLMRVPVPPEFVGRSFEDLARYFRVEQTAILIGLITEEEGIPIGEMLSGGSPIDAFIAARFREAGRDIAAESRQKADIVLNPPDSREIRAHDAAVIVGHQAARAG
ncbi:MAG: ion transporter [Chloroflexi bacterium]|nr:ion transporter [Chloroflexota bacterium]